MGETAMEKHDMDKPLSCEAMQETVNVIQRVMGNVMKNHEHYGVIPGCGDKPTLLKPGAEKLCMTFRLSPTYKITKTDLPGGHREYEIICTLSHIATGQVFGEGVGCATTMEGRYRFRKGEGATCPKCGQAALIKGKAEYGGGWLCFAKKGGCGAKFDKNDPATKNFNTGKIEHDNPADNFNMVLKIAKKRAHVDACLTALAASDMFNQDIEEEEMDGLIKEDPKNGGGNGDDGNKDAKVTGKPATQKQLNMLKKLANDKGIKGEVIAAHLKEKYGVEHGQELTTRQASEVIDWMGGGRKPGGVSGIADDLKGGGITEEQRMRVEELLGKKGIPFDEVKAYLEKNYKTQDVSTLTEQDAGYFINWLEESF